MCLKRLTRNTLGISRSVFNALGFHKINDLIARTGHIVRFVSFCSSSKMSSLIVQVPQGKLQGKENKSILNGSTYFSFLGIPYAKPPVGNLRFKGPEPSEKWTGIYDATYERECCIQNFLPPYQYVGSENCLYLSVDTPQLPSEVAVPKPVMVFIHGGGFSFGHGSQELYSSDYLITHDVILVRISYRLHVLGFLNLDLPDCAGNAGLKDQVMALKWVKNNISYFGGDPDNITIFGESAGGSSVHHQLISPLAKGLFHKAIVQSGSVLSPWAFSYDHKAVASEFRKRIGYTGDTKEGLLEFLKQQDFLNLTTKASEMAEDVLKRYPGRCIITPFTPSLEQFKDGAFLPELPEVLLETADPKPVIYGLTDRDGIIIFCTSPNETFGSLMKDFGTVLKNNFKINPTHLLEISAKIKKHYFGEKEISAEDLDPLIDMFADFNFYQLYESIEFLTKSSTPPYVYEFGYGGDLNIFKKMFASLSKKPIQGAIHGDDLGYLFHIPKITPEPSLTGGDLTVIENITKLWTNFAKTGAPTADESTWVPSSADKPCYLKIDRSLQLKSGKVYGERLQFLKDLLSPLAKTQDLF